MNNRFKFRIWDKKLKKLAKWGDNPYHNMEIMNYICVENPVTDWKHEDYILMQCTGLKDKNGKLIYEGDIVKYICDSDWCADGYHQCIDCHSGENFKIYWNENFCKFQYSTYDENELNFDIDEDTAEICLEVIGNIYENKELLESEG